MSKYQNAHILSMLETNGIRSIAYKFRSYENGEFEWEINEQRLHKRTLQGFFMSLFLPFGFPTSVSEDYLEYQIWDTIQAFCSSLISSVCLHVIFQGMGVGDNKATPLAAAMTWLIKDGVSHVGRIIFAWLQGTDLDCNCKKWRLFADILNDIALFLDILSVYANDYFILIISISGLLKSLVGVAGGATRTALVHHQSRTNNIADVSSKDQSQETCVNLIALICSLILIPLINGNLRLIWLLYTVMTIIHITANYLAVQCLVMNSLNIERYRIAAKHFLKDNKRPMLSVKEINRREGILFKPWKTVSVIKLGVSIKDLIKIHSHEEFELAAKFFQSEQYLICISNWKKPNFAIKIGFHKKAENSIHLKALFHAFIIEKTLMENTPHDFKKLLVDSTAETSFKFRLFILSLEKVGFDVNNTLFDVGPWKIEW